MATAQDKALPKATKDLTIRDNGVEVDTKSERPRKRMRPMNPDEARQQLLDEFLTPNPAFSTEWLNRLQQRWDDPTDLQSLFAISPTMTRTVIRFTREGLEGRVTGYKEVTVPAHSITAKNSTSLLRNPASRADFVRGKAGFLPFSPGGLDVGAANETAESLEQQEQLLADRIGADGLLQVAPGLRRGLTLPDAKKEDEDLEKEEEFKFGDVKPLREKKTISDEPQRREKNPLSELDSIDDLLPIEFPLLAPTGELTLTAAARTKQKEWAHMVDVNQELKNFHELVPNMAKEWPFELDTFQKEAVYHLENGDSVFVAAHTSAGKTVVAEYAIALAAKHMTKAIYTSPIKALSNQKFRDFRNIFDDVGILTGDVQINPEASCLIMTTEILRSMLYRGADLIRDVEFVIFDEVHYVNDLERGVVWEEVIIMLPEHVNLILLSATVPNTKEFASWVGRTKKKDIYVISTPKRPVPLEHFLWAGKQMFKIVSSDKKFLEAGWKAANDSLSRKKELPQQQQQQFGGRGGGQQRGNDRGGRGRGGPQQGGRGGMGGGGGRGGPPIRNPNAPTRGAGTFARGGRGGMRTSAAQDKTIWVHLVMHLKKEHLLPACIFVFSKRRCEENADALSNVDFCNQTEKSLIHMNIERSIARLKPEDRLLPQILRIRELLSRGIAVHHGGLLPIVKEMVEILFAKTLVKVLFATETFAMGLNLPTRTVVFSGYRKHDGTSFRNLLPGEYTQMAGRAGRRGLDPVGTVIIVSPMDEAPPAPTLRQMILGEPTKLQSQFRLTYSMILNLLRVEALKIEEMIKRSFSENSTQTMLPEHERQVLRSEEDLKKLQKPECPVCDTDLEMFHHHCMDVKNLNKEVMLWTMKTPMCKNIFIPKRVIIVQEKVGPRYLAVVALPFAFKKTDPTISVVLVKPESVEKQMTDLIPFILTRDMTKPEDPNDINKIKLEHRIVPVADVEFVTNLFVDCEPTSVYRQDHRGMFKCCKELARLMGSNFNTWQEFDWLCVSKNLDYRVLLDAKKEAIKMANDCAAIQCPEIKTHFMMVHEVYTIQENIAELKMKISDQNLQLLPDYNQRLEVLKELGFVDDTMRVQLKGRVACEINSTNELILTELVLENVLADYEPEEICALLSAFVFHEKTDVEPKLTPKLEEAKKKVINIANRVNTIQVNHQVILSPESDDFETKPRFGLMEVVYQWAKGTSFAEITELTDILEGSIVRVITRLDETCREVKNAARIIGDPSLFTKMETCQALIKRDVCHCASLYY